MVLERRGGRRKGRGQKAEGDEGGHMARRRFEAEQGPQALWSSSLTKWPLCSLVTVSFHWLCSGVRFQVRMKRKQGSHSY